MICSLIQYFKTSFYNSKGAGAPRDDVHATAEQKGRQGRGLTPQEPKLACPHKAEGERTPPPLKGIGASGLIGVTSRPLKAADRKFIYMKFHPEPPETPASILSNFLSWGLGPGKYLDGFGALSSCRHVYSDADISIIKMQLNKSSN